MADHEVLESAVAAYALGASTEDEQEEVRAHLESCVGCRELFQRLASSAAMLPLSAEEARPPARLGPKILAAAAAEHGGAQPAPRITRKRRIRLRRAATPNLWPRFRLSPNALAVALALAVVALAFWNLRLSQEIAQRQQPPQTVARYSLTGSGRMAEASGTVFVLTGQTLAFVSFRGLPAPASGKVDELWLGNSGGRMTRATVFVPDSDGAKVIVLSEDIRGYTVMAVTTEQGPDGSAAPTESPQLLGKLG